MTLRVLHPTFAVCQVTDLTAIDLSHPTVFIAHTEDELSVVCEEAIVPANATAIEHGWRMMKIEGVLDFSLLGIIARIAGLLADAGVSVFVVSTFNTDYILVREEKLSTALQSLRDGGYDVQAG